MTVRHLATIIFLCVLTARAATYYIDYAAGNDTNNGTSTATPWKTAPGMANEGTRTYTHAAGDQFIFKGGVTWSNACFPLLIASSGTSGAWDCYRSTNTYYGGGSFTQAVFDGGSSLIGGSPGNYFVYLNNVEYVRVKGIEFTRWYWTEDANGTAQFYGYACQNVSLEDSLGVSKSI